MAISRLTPEQATALLQLCHTQLTANACCCDTPYRKHRNVLVTLYNFLCPQFVVYAQDTLKDLEAVGLRGACLRVHCKTRRDLDAHHKTLRQFRVHQHANICHRRVLNKRWKRHGL